MWADGDGNRAIALGVDGAFILVAGNACHDSACYSGGNTNADERIASFDGMAIFERNFFGINVGSINVITIHHKVFVLHGEDGASDERTDACDADASAGPHDGGIGLFGVGIGFGEVFFELEVFGGEVSHGVIESVFFDELIAVFEIVASIPNRSRRFGRRRESEQIVGGDFDVVFCVIEVAHLLIGHGDGVVEIWRLRADSFESIGIGERFFVVFFGIGVGIVDEELFPSRVGVERKTRVLELFAVVRSRIGVCVGRRCQAVDAKDGDEKRRRDE